MMNCRKVYHRTTKNETEMEGKWKERKSDMTMKSVRAKWHGLQMEIVLVAVRCCSVILWTVFEHCTILLPDFSLLSHILGIFRLVSQCIRRKEEASCTQNHHPSWTISKACKAMVRPLFNLPESQARVWCLKAGGERFKKILSFLPMLLVTTVQFTSSSQNRIRTIRWIKHRQYLVYLQTFYPTALCEKSLKSLW